MFSQCKIEERTIMQKILIVEDDTNINNLLQEALSKAGVNAIIKVDHFSPFRY